MKSICETHGIPYGRWGASEAGSDGGELVENRFAAEDQFLLELDPGANRVGE
jgi:hypothetical protein